MKPHTRAITAVCVIVAAWFFTGWVGVIAAAAGLGLTWWRGPRWLGGAAFLALVGTMLATIFEETLDIDNYNSAFANDRPVAATSALVAGVLLFVLVVSAAVSERAPADDSAPGRSNASHPT